MKVYAVNGDHYIVDVEDGHPEALMVREREDGSLRLFARTSTKEGLVNSAYWEVPTEEESAELIEKLKEYQIPLPGVARLPEQ